MTPRLTDCALCGSGMYSICAQFSLPVCARVGGEPGPGAQPARGFWLHSLQVTSSRSLLALTFPSSQVQLPLFFTEFGASYHLHSRVGGKEGRTCCEQRLGASFWWCSAVWSQKRCHPYERLSRCSMQVWRLRTVLCQAAWQYVGTS